MIAALEHTDGFHFGYKDVAEKLSAYFDDVKSKIEEKKLTQQLAKEEEDFRIFVDDLLHKHTTQKSFFDFFDNLLRSEGQQMISSSSKDEAIYFCEQVEPIIKKIEHAQLNLESKDFETIDAFFAFNSAFALMNTIVNLYYDMHTIAESETDEYLDILAEEVKKSLNEPAKRTKVDSLEEFLHSL